MNSNPQHTTSGDAERGFEFVMVLGTHLAVGIPETSLAGEFRCRGQRFEASAEEPCTGFYDCLRSAEDEVVGIGYFPFDKLSFLDLDKDRLLNRLREADYAKLFDNLIIFLLLDRNASLALGQPGGEQEFKESPLFAGDNGDFALSIRTNYLSLSDLERFIASGTESVSIDVPTQNP